MTIAVRSPLLRDVASGQSEADAVWSRLRAGGSPLIEPDPQRPGWNLVTFVWRGEGDVDDVVVESVGLPQEAVVEGVPQTRLRRLAGTDIWFATFGLAANHTASYWMNVRRSGRAGRTRDPLNPRTALFYPPVVPDGKVSALAARDLPDDPPPVTGRTVDAVLRGHRVRLHATEESQEARRDLLVCFDGSLFHDLLHAPGQIDRLRRERRVPPLLAVFVDPVTPESRDDELWCNPSLVDLLVDEVLPFARHEHALVGDARRSTVAGVSLGGLAASYAALARPDIFGNVLSMSGAFWRGERPRPTAAPELTAGINDAAASATRWEWLSGHLASSSRRPVRFHLVAGVTEVLAGGPYPPVLWANRHLHQVLLARGYDVSYSEYAGGHDPLAWRAAFPGALAALHPATSLERSPQS